jgi:hypothetical protein
MEKITLTVPESRLIANTWEVNNIIFDLGNGRIVVEWKASPSGEIRQMIIDDRQILLDLLKADLRANTLIKRANTYALNTGFFVGAVTGLPD